VRGGGQPIAELGERGEQEGVNTVEGKKTEGGKGGGWERGEGGNTVADTWHAWV
jgi:hypothetical protein